MKAMDKKLARDLWRLKGQVVSIALVIASGIALLVMALSTHEALEETASAYYERYRFGQVFANVKRAPLHLEDRISAIEGVQNVQLRISMQAVLEVENFAEPLMGRLVSVPEGKQPVLNRLLLKSGRLIEPGRSDEIVINDSFAKAHGLRAGHTIHALIDDKKRELHIVGTATSPEFIYVISPFALIPDKKRYAIVWMGRRAMEAAYDFEGSFNDLAVTALRGADTRPIIQALDVLFARFGGIGAIDRSDHLSHWFVSNEVKQQQTSARILPAIFLLVAAFLTNTVLTRLIATERSEIGLMKAFGYSSTQVGWHYAKMVLAICAVGILLGWLLGAYLGRISTDSYVQNLNFPLLIYRPGPYAFVLGALVSLAVGLVATARAVRGAARLPPIVAMRPPAPPQFRQAGDRARRLLAALDEPTRIIFRQISRWPGRAMVTILGFAGAVGMMVLSLQFTDAVDEMARAHFNELQREDVAIGFNDAKSTVVLEALGRLPGVMAVEPMRVVSATFSVGAIRHRGAIQGLSSNAVLTRIYDVERGPLAVPAEGLVLSVRLAEKLNVRVGDSVRVAVKEGRRPIRYLKVARIFESYIGMSVYMDLAALDRLMGERPLTQYVKALVDELRTEELLGALKNLPTVSTVALKSVAVDNFFGTIAQTLMIFVGFFSAFSMALGFGVSYNAQRIALSERGRELATLRVLGFSKGEALYILLGEVLLLVCLSLPVGCAVGWALTALFVNASGFQTELMRLPLIIEPSTYGSAVVALLLPTLVAGLVIKRRVDRLNLISVLKTRE